MMKVSIVLVISALISAFMATPVLANSPISVKINGNKIEMDVSPQIKDGIVLIPISAAAEVLEKEVVWDEELREIRIQDKVEILYEEDKEKIKILGTKQSGYYSDLKVVSGESMLPIEGKNVGNPTYAPTINVVDLNGDGKKQIVIILTTGYGTGLLQTTVQVLDKESLFINHIEDPMTYLMKNVYLSMKNSDIEININGKKTIVTKDKIETAANNVFKKPGLGSYIRYYVENNQLKVDTGIQVAPAEYIGNLQVAYTYKNGFYQGNSIELKLDK